MKTIWQKRLEAAGESMHTLKQMDALCRRRTISESKADAP